MTLYNQIIDRGYACLKNPIPFGMLDAHCVEWSEKGTIPLQMVKRTEEVENSLKTIQKYLGEKYIRALFGEYHMDYCDLVNGMDQNVYDWHNDYEPNKVNLGILLYYTSTDEVTGSGIGFRDPISKIEHAFFYPKEGDVCILNHTEKFEHRVTPQNFPVPRIVASFHYYVNTLN